MTLRLDAGALPLVGPLLRRPPLDLVIPLAALVHRRVTGRWWREVEEGGAHPGDVAADHVADRLPLAEGTGDVLHRRYAIRLPAGTDPVQVVAAFAHDPNRYMPVSYATFDVTPLQLGTRATVALPGPWNGPVEVVEAPTGGPDDGVRLVTRDGHMEAGWIRFGVQPVPTGHDFVIESVATAGDPAFWVLHEVVELARAVQTDTWARVCEAVARDAGADPLPHVRVHTRRSGREAHPIAGRRPTAQRV